MVTVCVANLIWSEAGLRIRVQDYLGSRDTGSLRKGGGGGGD